jgi:O-acetyl-ADP-ribose deacetylase
MPATAAAIDSVPVAPERAAAPICQVDFVVGDAFDLAADGVVNPWNRNFLPRWALIPSGFSAALKRRTGPEPWRQLRRAGLLDVGQAVVTPGGNMLDVWLIHVAGINARWRATDESVSRAAQNAVRAAWKAGCRHVVMPLIGAGTGGMSPDHSRELIAGALTPFMSPAAPMRVTVVSREPGAPGL